MKSTYKQCQSCGMPMRKDEMGGGTNADGSKNVKYCSHCFASGQFTLPQISADEMQARVKSKLRESGVPSAAAWFLTRGIPKLERWSKV
jgi:Putative zinc ribbon domain